MPSCRGESSTRARRAPTPRPPCTLIPPAQPLSGAAPATPAAAATARMDAIPAVLEGSRPRGEGPTLFPTPLTSLPHAASCRGERVRGRARAEGGVPPGTPGLPSPALQGMWHGVECGISVYVELCGSQLDAFIVHDLAETETPCWPANKPAQTAYQQRKRLPCRKHEQEQSP